MDPMLIGALLLLVLGLGLVILEVFVPSGGLIGCLAGISLILALVLGFYHSQATGMIVLGTIVLGLPICLAVALRYWPNTSMGRRILLNIPTSEEVLPNDPHRQRLKKLVGQIGRAKSVMLPSGAIDVAGQTIDAVSEGMAIEAEQLVRVIEVRGNRVVVRPADQDVQPDLPLPDSSQPDLNRPIDSVAEDPFKEPLV